MVVPLRTRAEFDAVLVNFHNREDVGRHWCEEVDTPWSEKVTCSGTSALRTRDCTTVGKALKPCPDICPEESESVSVVANSGLCSRQIVESQANQ